MRIEWKLKLLVTAMAVALLAIASGASSAMAVLEKPHACAKATNIKGKGSSLQKIAQNEVWDSGAKGFNLIESEGGALGCALVVGEPVVTYESTGSGPGLEAWGAITAKVGMVKESGDAFVGTDDAPNEEQMKRIDISAESSEVADVVVIPVAQAAIAMIVDPPIGCKFKEHEIKNEDLQKVWSGEFTEWKQITTTEGCGTAKITRIVRKEGSGTTYQFKHYLSEIKEKGCPAAPTWTSLQPIEEERNTRWPECGTIKPEKIGMGGNGEVEKVAEKEGTIGYANLADVRKGLGKRNFTWLAVENGKEHNFQFPGKTAGEPAKVPSESNCTSTEYTSISGKEKAAEELNFDWSGVYGGHPTGDTHYTICTLTWDLALHCYVKAGLKEGEKITAEKFFKYVIGEENKTYLEGGQEAIRENHDYQSLPTAPDIYKIAQRVLSRIGGC